MESTPEFREYVRGLRTDHFAGLISFHEDDQLWHTSAYVRVRHGVYFLRTRYQGDQPIIARLVRDARVHGRFSNRPVRMGQYFDGSMLHGAVELLRHWCEAQQIDVLELWARAYPGEAPQTADDREEVRVQAQWEGIIYPQHWTMALTRQLGSALREVGYLNAAWHLARLASRMP